MLYPDPEAQIRLEPRPRRGIHPGLLASRGKRRTAIELRYLVAALHASVAGELFDLPHQSANDISRHDVVKDITRVETLLADAYADEGCDVVLTNDRSYWQPDRPGCPGSPRGTRGTRDIGRLAMAADTTRERPSGPVTTDEVSVTAARHRRSAR